MERQQKIKKKRKRIRVFIDRSPSLSLRDEIIFAVLLAATVTNYTSLIKKCLSRLQSQLSLPSKQTHIIPILALLPILLNSRSSGIARRSAEIVGALALLSLEMNEQIVLDSEIVKALVMGLGSPNKRVSFAVCSALLDLSITCAGRNRLLHFSALERLISEFLQVSVSFPSVGVCMGNSRNVASARIAFSEDGPAVSLLNAAVTLANACSMERLEMIPGRLSQKLLYNLKNLWEKVHDQTLDDNTCKSGQWRPNNISVNNLAESIFRLSISANQFVVPFSSVSIKKQFFGADDLCFKSFMLNYWEASPFLLTRLSRSSTEEDIFSSFSRCLSSKGLFPTFLSMLKSFVSCVPLASDEMNILSFLEEARNELGCPIKYQQDIRVVRTEQSEREVHFFCASLDLSCNKPSAFVVDDIMKCEEAYKEGYTIALRGVEFRFASIAAIADCLASLFGQPSVGVNMYLTPPNSQGLARHYDDHCVFVCQLIGTKQWKVFSQPALQLPRLYDPPDSQHGLEVESLLGGCRKMLLKEGDILYIPRGFAHEACTDDGASSDFSGFSLHVTFGIEVEPPFEWEGFAHVALHCWYHTQKKLQCALPKTLALILNFVSVNLLHSMIELISTSDTILRKACLVGSHDLPMDALSWLNLEQKSIFSYVISQIKTESKFLHVFRSTELAIAKTDDPFWRMRWLQLLNQEKEVINEHECNMPFVGVQNLWAIYAEHKDKAEVAFIQLKLKFCDQVLFEDTIDNYRILLEKYKKTRKQYMNGMLSLNSN